jgi:hypothetical protein
LLTIPVKHQKPMIGCGRADAIRRPPGNGTQRSSKQETPMLDPNTVSAGRSKRMFVDGHELHIEIYRHAHETLWTLALADEDGALAVWADLFATEQAAMDKALKTIEENGLSTRARRAEVIPFPSTRAKRVQP